MAATIGIAGITVLSEAIVSRPSPAAMTWIGHAGIEAEPDAVAEKVAQRAARIGDLRLAVAGGIEPGALHAGDDARRGR